MKTKFHLTPRIWHLALGVLLLSTLNSQLSTLRAQGLGFTYQGRLNDNGAAASGNYDLAFTLYNAASGGTTVGSLITLPAVPVSNGLFTVIINTNGEFGATAFNGDARWLEIGVRTNCNCLLNFTLLSPRQPVTAAPYAITASNLSGTLPASSLAGAYTSALTLSNAANQFFGAFTGNGNGVTNLNASQLTSGTVPDARLAVSVARTNQVWLLNGNAGTASGPNFIGTTDNQSLQFKVNNLRALWILPGGDSTADSNANDDLAPSLIGGSFANTLGLGVVGATIAGGGAGNFNGISVPNQVRGDYGTVGGGMGNNASNIFSVVAGGRENRASGQYATVGGGYLNAAGGTGAVIGGGGTDGFSVLGNTASGLASTVGGGTGNTAGGNYATAAGGVQNAVNGNSATVGGGQQNISSTNLTTVAGGYNNTANSPYATVAGGAGNIASGPGAFVGGGGFNGISVAHNTASSTGSTVSGGVMNTASAPFAVVGGGENNSATGGAGTTVGGGQNNSASFAGSTVAGGIDNSAAGGDATVAGGGSNTASDFDATVGGGADNIASGFGSTIPGGLNCTAAGDYSFAAGRRAKANHQGSFIWCDSLDQDGGSPANNSFTVRASGGIYLFTSSGSTGVQVGAGGGSWSSISDRNVKENFQIVNAQDVLARVTAMPLSTWNYKTQDKTVRHIGPMAQDFYAAFNVGEDDRHITTVDADGVALAAIQGLDEKLEVRSQRSEDRSRKLEEQLQQKETEIAELKQRLETLEKIILNQK